MSLRTPLAKVRGLGSARTGTHHWIAERVTALALVPLCTWFVYSIIMLVTNGTYSTDMAGAEGMQLAIQGWLQSPWHALAMVLFTTLAFYHSMLGVQVIVEDYVHKKPSKFTLLLLNAFTHYFSIAASLMAVAKIHFFAPPIL